MTKIVTFYSYKGGVGRTMALVNVAHVLAQKGWRVLMIDFDLEAPGLTHFFSQLVSERSSEMQGDALDLLIDAKKSFDPQKSESDSLPKRVSLTSYSVNIPLSSEWLRSSKHGIAYCNGRLDFIPATLETISPSYEIGADLPRSYLNRLDKLDLSQIFASSMSGLRYGHHLRRYLLNNRFQTPGDILFTLRESVHANYDIILVDSRTGLNEISGLCIGPLCDSLVICTGLNHQNILGTRYFMGLASLLEGEKSKPYIVAVGPVPPWHHEKTTSQIQTIEKHLKPRHLVQVPYHPAAAVKETIFVQDDPGEVISEAYRSLAEHLTTTSFPPIYDYEHESSYRTSVRNMAASDASHLNLLRLRHDDEYQSFPTYFPTAYCIRALPNRFSNEPDRSISLSIAAALAANRIGDDRPFFEAYEICRKRDNEKRDVAWAAEFLDMAVLHHRFQRPRSIPPKIVNRVLEVVARYIPKGSTVKWHPENTLNIWHAVVASIEILGWSVDEVKKSLQLSDEKLFFERAHLWEFHEAMEEWSIFRRTLSTNPYVTSEFLQMMMYLSISDRELVQDPLEKILKSKYVGHELENFLNEKIPPEEIFWHRSKSRRRYPRRFPLLGFQPELILAACLSISRGPKALPQILRCLSVVRLSHGCAWRVLIDQRHLAPIKDAPAFKEFLAEEDVIIKDMEDALDRGDYPF
jgi:MinD-like ATPase involved in chromosome partitioning or flagellar assembly